MPDNVDVVRSIYDALAAGDVAKVLAALDESVQWYVAENSPLAAVDGKPFTGTQSVVENVFARLPQLIDGFTIDVQRLVGSGDTVLAENRYAGTGKATGRRLDIQAAHVWELRDGKVVQFQQYVDTYAYRKALAPAE